MKESDFHITEKKMKEFVHQQLPTKSVFKNVDVSVLQNFSIDSYSEGHYKTSIPDSRRDFHKITLISKGEGTIKYDGHHYDIREPSLIFINPTSVLNWKATSATYNGFYCMFRKGFWRENRTLAYELKTHPLFRVGNTPLIFLSSRQVVAIENIFKMMMEEYQSSKPLKSQMLMLHLHQLLLEGRRMHDRKTGEDNQLDAAHLHTQSFLQLLEDQFPISSIQQRVTLTRPGHFAEKMAIHLNHLNKQVKEVTGQSTNEHIQRRLLLEGRLLLVHTDWAVADIGFCLGFSEPTSFSHFFKRHTGQTPSSFRS